MKYEIIYADPPWSYNSRRAKYIKNNSWETAKHYDTMSLEEIKNLNIKGIAADNCIIFMWATLPLLQEWLDVLKAWGFKYKTTGFTWIKQYSKSKKICFWLGSYTRSNAEVCLIGIRGKPKIYDKNISSVIIADRGKHSKKPDIVRVNIEKMCRGTKIELFAREKVDWWDSYWNEIIDSISIT